MRCPRSAGLPLVPPSGQEGVWASKARTGGAIKDSVSPSASFSTVGARFQEGSWQLQE
jgi:hypothetical protein